MPKIISLNFSPLVRRHLKVAAAFGVGLSLAMLTGSLIENYKMAWLSENAVVDSGTDSIYEPDVPPLPAAAPRRLSIPKLGIHTDFEEPLGLNPDQTIEVPESYTNVGWYQFGPTPGELGPAVILGHVDSYQGPAVFYTLGQLKPGDQISIERADGSAANFVVTRLERHEQAGFPTAAVYGDIDHAGLRLITCSGTFNRGQERYTHNLIVFAKLATTSAEAL